MIVGEVALQDLHRVVGYLESGDQLHLAHNFVFIDQDWDAEAYATVDRRLRGARGGDGVAGVVPGQPRQAARRAAASTTTGSAPQRARAILVMLYALRGTPFVYQGEELGLPDARDPARARRRRRRPRPRARADPVDRRRRRATASPAGEPWLPFVDGRRRAQRRDPGRTTRTRRCNLTRRARRDCARDARRCSTGAQRPFDAGAGVLAWTREGEASGCSSRSTSPREPRPLDVERRARAVQRPRPRTRRAPRSSWPERGAHPAPGYLDGQRPAGVGVEEVQLRRVEPDLGRLAGPWRGSRR